MHVQMMAIAVVVDDARNYLQECLMRRRSAAFRLATCEYQQRMPQLLLKIAAMLNTR